ncbi:MAG: anthranilate synthase component I family protein, partial [Fidelibacterota bacterium]
MTNLGFDEFSELARKYRTVPVYEKVLADLLTPISAYLRLSRHSDYAFLLESVEKGTRYSRYSFIGTGPKKIIKHVKGETTITENGVVHKIKKPFLEILRELLKEYGAPRLPGIPGFSGGLVGYLGYETVTWMENIPTHSPDELDVPDAIFMLFEELLAFDHLKNEAVVFSNVNIGPEADLQLAYRNAKDRIDTMGRNLHTEIDYQTPERTDRSKLYSNMSQAAFESAVSRSKEYIEAGDIFQIVLSQRFHRHTSVDPLTLYRALRTINPSPYMFHFKLNDFQIAGASPELLVKVEQGEVEIRPIAGTRPRGENPEQDEHLARELLSDEKERAEHLMLLDLGRNDVGRVAEAGSVQVREFAVVEKYSHVMHLVSDVRGRLDQHKDVIDALVSGFPAGTTTGSPKIRAMELIHELEPSRRNIYSGAVGYIDFAGDMNTCI